MAPRGSRRHAGIDMAAMRGTPVRASANGTVIQCYEAPSYGKTILISHSPLLKTRYAHLKKFQVRKGMRVQRGQIIGYVGNSGSVQGKNGDHLHFEVLYKNKPTNPMQILG